MNQSLSDGFDCLSRWSEINERGRRIGKSKRKRRRLKRRRRGICGVGVGKVI